MRNILRCLHTFSTVAFLGSILGYVVLAERVKTEQSVQDVYIIFSYVDFAVVTLTVPAMFVCILSGIALAVWKRAGMFREGWIVAKTALSAVIVSVALLAIVPLFHEKVVHARASLAAGRLTQEFLDAQRLEDTFGVSNLLLVALAIVLSIYRPGAAWRARAARPSVGSAVEVRERLAP